MKKYFAYTRVSTVKQGEKGVSLIEQKSAIEQYATREGLDISHWFKETVSAAKQGRPKFDQLLSQIRAGEAQGLIVHKLDRGTRNLDDWLVLRDLHKEGIDLRIVMENIDLTTRSGRMIGNFQAVIAEDYIENLRQETMKGQLGRLKQGLTPWAAPVGYLNNGQGQVKTIDSEKGPLIKQLFELYLVGDYSQRTLATHMYELGLRNVAGGRITKTGISTILNNPFYIGRIKVKKWDKVFEGAHEPLIPKSLFYAVQDSLAGKCGPKLIKHDFCYRRMFRCKQCSYSLIPERQKGHVYYRCHTRSCPMTGIREEVLTGAVSSLFSELAMDDIHVNYLQACLNEMRDVKDKVTVNLQKARTLERANICAREKRVTELHLDGDIDREEYRSRKADIQRKLDEWNEREARDLKEPDGIFEEAEKILELARSLIASAERGNGDEVRLLMNKVTSNRTISPESVDLPCLSPWHLFLDKPKWLTCPQTRDTVLRGSSMTGGHISSQNTDAERNVDSRSPDLDNRHLKDSRADADAFISALLLELTSPTSPKSTSD